MDGRSHAIARLDASGTDSVCEAIGDGQSLTAIALEIGVSIGSLLAWCERDPERSARVREARRLMARVWDERAEALLDAATDDFELKKAKEISYHYRWRASKIAPGEYSDKLEVSGNPDRPLVPPVVQFLGIEPRK